MYTKRTLRRMQPETRRLAKIANGLELELKRLKRGVDAAAERDKAYSAWQREVADLPGVSCQVCGGPQDRTGACSTCTTDQVEAYIFNEAKEDKA